jgi:hypothetical protein
MPKSKFSFPSTPVTADWFYGDCAVDKVPQLPDNSPWLSCPTEDNDMIRISLQFFYDIGSALEPLKRITVGDEVFDYFSELFTADEKLEGLLRNQVIPLRTSYENGQVLLAQISNLIDKFSDPGTPDEPTDTTITQQEQHLLSEAIKNFETVLAAELRILDTYFVSQKGGYSTAHLIELGHTLLPEDVRSAMPEGAMQDFKQGCRCLAFDLGTAAGFHLFRATEAVLDQYYDVVATQKNLPPKSTMGQTIAYLKANGGDPKIMSVLEQLTTLHRNPVIHPEDTLTANQALTLIGMVISALVAMLEATIKAQISVSAPSLSAPTVSASVPAPAANAAASGTTTT